MEELASDPKPARPTAVSRRGFVGLGAAATAGLGAAAVGLGGAGLFGAAQDATPGASSPVASPHDAHGSTPAATPGGTPAAIPGPAFVAGEDLREPEIRISSNGLLETTLQAWQGSVPLAGQVVTTYCYEGMIPGPTMRLRGGDTLNIKLVNGLAGTTNIHTHGFHVSPLDNGDNVLLHVEPGETFHFQYNLPATHYPGLYWYHPHFHGDSEAQVNGGMAGAIIIEGDLDQLPGIAGVPEQVLLFQVSQFGPDGAVLPLPEQKNVTRFVNGQLQPVIRMRPGETRRWRFGNISADFFFNFQLDGHQLHQISKDGNTLAEVWARDVILIEPAARVEVLIQAGEAGTYALKNVPWPEGSQVIPEAVLATLVVEGEPVDPQPLPAALIPFEDYSQLAVDNTREITFQIEQGPSGPVFQISGQQFDENVVNQTAKLGTLEEWTINNASAVWHPFHIHINDYQVTKINGEPVQARSYEDTTAVPAMGSITMRTRYNDFVGKWVYHCHILGHEDRGMMGIIEVVE